MNPANPRANVWKVWAGCAVAATALTATVYYAGIAPVQASRSADVRLAEQARGKAEQADILQEQLDRLNQKLTTLRGRLNEHPVTLGDPEHLNRRIAALIDLARQAGLDVMQLQPGGSQPAEHYDLKGLRLEAAGSFDQHRTFLVAVHERFTDMSVVGLDLTQPRGAQRANRPDAVYNIVWFTLVADEAPAAS